MSQFGDYSRYYNLLYNDKDYAGEARYVDSLIKRYAKNSAAILELGCGTGRYTAEFAAMGYRVHGVDLSEDMLREARNIKDDSIELSRGDARNIRLGKKFDVVAALFHVMSYQLSNKDVFDVLVTMKAHLNEGGIALFDFWYGPAVLTRGPETRFKEVENGEIKVSRVAVPVMDVARNIVSVNYSAFIRNKRDGSMSTLHETHNMRYFFDTELLMFSDLAGMAIADTEAWLGGKAGVDVWSAVKVLRVSDVR
ncbi:MAG: class I SAM-dependent methyltransferase [Synergistaceae bacterium]|jgi:SAM-dependent methyltransferase|nr:class I SAM-dependent methyltransferase [Synergistaceae bacterium]